MIEFKGDDAIEKYKPYEKIIKTKCDFISSEDKKVMATMYGVYDTIDRYLCPCGMVKITKSGSHTKIESDGCGFK